GDVAEEAKRGEEAVERGAGAQVKYFLAEIKKHISRGAGGREHRPRPGGRPRGGTRSGDSPPRPTARSGPGFAHRPPRGGWCASKPGKGCRAGRARRGNRREEFQVTSFSFW